MRFTVLNTENKSRLGRYTTAHGTFETPNFMPVGTKATVKGVDVERLKELGTQITLVNTYHLWLRPGESLVHKLGGIHKFCGFDGPILSDSGGYQVFSLKGLREITEEGVAFRSHLDGARCMLTPEKSIQIQETLGVDIAMCFDECPAADYTYEQVSHSLDRTLRWAKRCRDIRSRPETLVFGITQGGKFANLRKHSAQALQEIGFDGYAVGGLSVGEKKEIMYEVLSYHPQELPADSIRYLMGVGTPQDLVEGVHSGIDLFDCVMPTRSGRFARAFIRGDEPYLNLRNARFAEDPTPLDATCHCICCRNYSRAYLHHLFRNDEMLGPVLLSNHNLTHYLDLMRTMRERIAAGTFEAFYQEISRVWKDWNSSSGE